ncbi:hypothetical protein LCGC14_0808790 [marine sediment metagenome]|uniref:DUF445 domain-containing protein n=1 Tax=marine sediment metagenome TaxID=412755 RepID=A0A0F9SUV7_9ZZZZ|nr:DUF445 domain-containing protein [Methylophaga sp.]HEC59977.1 DUF445 domain-containing protein [Methylophaga sp.]
MNKSLITNVIAAGLVATGLVLNAPFREPVLATGLFALAGGVTNWLAVYMLFEKVPGLYGSGVISARFEDFKAGIHSLVMEQFFSKDNLDRFFLEMGNNQDHHQLDFHDVIEETDLSGTYDSLVETIMESSFGSMLGMFGGLEALTPLKAPFIVKMKQSLNDLAHSDSFQNSVREKLANASVGQDIHLQIEHVVSSRLEELTPQMVKDIIQAMIRQHLGWLVVWGGVFGGLIGLIASQLPL